MLSETDPSQELCALTSTESGRAPPPSGVGDEWLPSPAVPLADLVPWMAVTIAEFLICLVGNGVLVIWNFREWTRKAEESS